MIYLDTSVALAHLFDENAAPAADFWMQPLVSSELLEYELTVRINARRLPLEPARRLLARVNILPLQSAVLRRALEPFPSPVRTLDALHLASFDFLLRQGQSLQMATYDDGMRAAAAQLGYSLLSLTEHTHSK